MVVMVNDKNFFHRLLAYLLLLMMLILLLMVIVLDSFSPSLNNLNIRFTMM